MFKSKKFIALVVSLVALVLVKKLGLEVEEAQQLGAQIVGVVASYMVGQGIADHGKGAAEAKS